jgi:hypothetical protein
MKINKLLVPVSITAALAGMVACAVSCAKKSSAPPSPAPPEPVPTNSVTDNTAAAAATNTAPETPTITNTPPPSSSEITNPPPAETTTKAPETNSVAETNLPGHNTVVDMATNPPIAPTHFYPPVMSSNSACCLTPVGVLSNTNFYVALRGGYQHINHGDNNDSYWASIKLYAFGDGLREEAGKNAWLIPDASLEIFSGYVAKPDNVPNPGSGPGFGLRGDFTWPWIRWNAAMGHNADSIWPWARPMSLSVGPTVNLGFDHLYDEYKYRFAGYAGVRLTIDRTGFIEYTVGDTIGLAGTRQQVVAELPFLESRDGEVRYYLRGLWNRGTSSKPDVLEGGVFVEMPLGLLVTPGKWGDLVPFIQ